MARKNQKGEEITPRSLKVLGAPIAMLSLCMLLSTNHERRTMNYLHAVEIHPDAGTTSAAFLKIGVGARAVAMGGAFTGLSDDLTALYWNPAGLARLAADEFHVSHNESFEGIRHDFIGHARPLRGAVIAGAIYGLYTPNDIERRSGINENDPYEPLSPVEGYFQAYDVAAQFSYGRALRENLWGGASVKLIQQNIDGSTALGAGMDLGLLYAMKNKPLDLGLSVQNIGTPMRFAEKGYALPLNLKAGAAWRWNPRFVTTLDGYFPNDNFPFVSAGAEYRILEAVALRLGYRYRWHGLELGDLSGLSAGAGFHFSVSPFRFRLDYAFIPEGVLGNSHRVSLNILAAPAATQRTAKIREKKKATATPLPAPGEIVSPGVAAADRTDGEDRSSYRLKMRFTLMMSAGRAVVFRVLGEAEGGDLQRIEGVTAANNARRITVEVRETTGEGAVHRRFSFRPNVPVEIKHIRCTVRVPADIERVAVVTPEGARVAPEKISEDAAFRYYRFPLASLSDFAIEKE